MKWLSLIFLGIYINPVYCQTSFQQDLYNGVVGLGSGAIAGGSLFYTYDIANQFVQLAQTGDVAHRDFDEDHLTPWIIEKIAVLAALNYTTYKSAKKSYQSFKLLYQANDKAFNGTITGILALLCAKYGVDNVIKLIEVLRKGGPEGIFDEKNAIALTEILFTVGVLLYTTVKMGKMSLKYFNDAISKNIRLKTYLENMRAKLLSMYNSIGKKQYNTSHLIATARWD